MGFEGLFKKKEMPVAIEANDNEAAVDTEAIARKIETLADSSLTPLSMARQYLVKERENILKVEDPGKRSVLEGKFDAAALKMWTSIIGNNMDTRPLGASLSDSGEFSVDDQNVEGVKEFPFFDTETRMEAVKLAELKQEGWNSGYIGEKRRLQNRESDHEIEKKHNY